MIIAEKLAEDPKKYSGEVFNAGTNTPISIKTVVEDIYKLVSNEKDLKQVIELMEGKIMVGEIEQQYMDFEKLNVYFGWEPKYSLREGMIRTIEWFKEYLGHQYEYKLK